MGTGDWGLGIGDWVILFFPATVDSSRWFGAKTEKFIHLILLVLVEVFTPL
ncbi:hypothetical protein [Nostoc sp. CMAA1605]|uniref:hypothetical protein n=1 Tax=Nostoc sp. CMAA1605 TaxID=2055159 RepID=UPI001F29BF7A|nr:hypothetical protein [Nostoc sp. CMAA1605]